MPPARILRTSIALAALLLAPAELRADACCMGEFCFDVPLPACTGFFATYLEGETCDAVDCTLPRACCDDGICHDWPLEDCGLGDPGEPGSTCATTACDVQACCLHGGPADCFDVYPDECVDQWLGHPEGEGTMCADADACEPRACCEAGFCEVLNPSECRASGRTPGDPGSTCQTACPIACCLSDGTCTTQVPDECVAAGGTPRPGPGCDIRLCTPRTSCCLRDGGCIEVPAGDCVAVGVPSIDPGGTCAFVDCPPSEACCLATQDCIDTAWSTCLDLGGRPAGGGLTCASIADCADLPAPGRVPASLTVQRGIL